MLLCILSLLKENIIFLFDLEEILMSIVEVLVIILLTAVIIYELCMTVFPIDTTEEQGCKL